MTHSKAPEKPLGLRIRQALQAVADPNRAPAMQAYMKSTMPYLGVSSSARGLALKPIIVALDWRDGHAWHKDVLSVWRGARFREERYAALSIAGAKAAHRFHDLEALMMYEELIVSGAWWDYVDEIASHRLWAILQNDRSAMRSEMLRWSAGPNLWKRRSAILCQLRAKKETDLGLLYGCIEPSIGSTEFFLRKAIGWALRQFAWTDPAEVARYVADNDARLSGLSKREALKNRGKMRT